MWFRKCTTVPEDTQLLTSLVWFNLCQSESNPGPPCIHVLPELTHSGTWTSPLHLSCCRCAAMQKRLKCLPSWVMLLAGFSSQGVGAYTWKGHGPVSFPKTGSARWGHDKVFLLPGVLEELSLLSLLFSGWDIFSAGGEEASFHQKTTV